MEYLCRYFGDGFLGLIGESHHGPLLAGRGSPLCVSVAQGLTTAASVAALATANLDPVQACPHRGRTAAKTAEACISEPCRQANCLASVLPAVPVGLTCVCTAATLQLQCSHSWFHASVDFAYEHKFKDNAVVNFKMAAAGHKSKCRVLPKVGPFTTARS